MGLLKSIKKVVGGSVGKVAGSAFGALVGGPAGASVGYNIGSMFDSANSSSNATKEAKQLYQWQLAQETNNNIRLWNMNNEYNTPKNQMLRFKEAGLNPNLIYGQTNTASPISTASANFSLDNTGSQKSLSNYLAMSNLGIQKDLSSAQVRQIDNSIDMNKANLALNAQRVENETGRLKLDRDRFALDSEMANAGLLGQYLGRRNSARFNDWLYETFFSKMNPVGGN